MLDFNGASRTLLITEGANADSLTVSVSGGKYTFKDTGETISVTAAAAALGFTGSGSNTVTGGSLPAADSISIIGSNTINIQSIANPMTVTGVPAPTRSTSVPMRLRTPATSTASPPP